MLRLTNVTKDYKVADTTVKALKGVDLSFRKNEFVSILGPSGCGKTTLLNIIGGLDKYTKGDIHIAGKSTKLFTDADWDVYRNHRVGFIFQSYNLIPHQTVLGNVELALTIAGVSKAERTQRAKKALDRVGLSGQYYKRPNQLSGGQCQRVAIARALVNEPEILLADEPTGALDTETSVQIMDLIKEIAQERLVIMVTHNPELAEKYSTRIIRLLDGLVLEDSMPYIVEDEIAECEKLAKEEKDKEKEEREQWIKANPGKKYKRKQEKAKMKLLTTIRLSAQNLLSKKARTIMTSVAGSIGIIGVSLVLAISSGITNFIDSMQRDMLSGNPITVDQMTFDFESLMSSIEPKEEIKKVIKDGEVNVNEMVENLISRSEDMSGLTINNNITKDYVDYVKAMPSKDVASINLKYGLDVSNNIYTGLKKANASGGEDVVNTSISAIKTLYVDVLKKQTEFAQYASYINSVVQNFEQAPINEKYALQQYDIKAGKYATETNEVMIVVDADRELTDVLLAQLGYFSQAEFTNVIYRSVDDERYDAEIDKKSFTYEELLGKEFTYYPNNTVYSIGQDGIKYNHESTNFTGGEKLKVVGILQPKDGLLYGSMKSGFFYTSKFAEKFIQDNKDSMLVQALKRYNTAVISSGWTTNPESGEKVLMPGSITYQFEYYYFGEKQTDTGFVGSSSSLSAIMGMFMPGMAGGGTDEMFLLSLQQIGGNELPSSLAIYPTDFETKENVVKYLNEWNSDNAITIGDRTLQKADRERIVITDTLSLIIDLLNSFIQIVTIALVGFTALSLVVSTVMIAIITYVSVVERTKEIGVIRSLGGRKKDVSRLFTAETGIIGLASGIIGILITYIVSAIINAIVGSVAMIDSIAALPFYMALIMIAISVVLTLISGVFPAKAAAKKDPVVALRTE